MESGALSDVSPTTQTQVITDEELPQVSNQVDFVRNYFILRNSCHLYEKLSILC